MCKYKTCESYFSCSGKSFHMVSSCETIISHFTFCVTGICSVMSQAIQQQTLMTLKDHYQNEAGAGLHSP